jgi:hypothetical protein
MTLRFRPALFAALLAAFATAAPAQETPAARWDHRPKGQEWTEAMLAAIERNGQSLISTVPRDIEQFCPAYAKSDADDRAAFWVGLFSALAKHESTWNPAAKGEGGKYRGLLQITPATARAYGCDSRNLYDAETNLSCAVNIAAVQVARGQVVAGGPGRWGGVAADWGPMRNRKKLADIAAWTSAQDYCIG